MEVADRPLSFSLISNKRWKLVAGKDKNNQAFVIKCSKIKGSITLKETKIFPCALPDFNSTMFYKCRTKPWWCSLFQETLLS